MKRAVRGLCLLLMTAFAGPAAAGLLRVSVNAPLPTAGFAARVVARDGTLVAVIRAGDAAEVEAGRYKVELMTDPPIVKTGVVVPADGETIVRFDELGVLRFLVSAEDGQAVATVAEVFMPDGRRLDAIANGGERLLPAGTYRVVVRSKPNKEFPQVRIVGGKTRTVEIRLGSAIEFDAIGPDGARAPVTARVVHPDGGVLGFAAGETLSLPPGDYDVSLDTVPPMRRRVTLEAGATARLRLEDLGALKFDYVDADGTRPSWAVTVLDPLSGLILARSRNGESLVVRPGKYRVRFESSPPVLREGVRVPARGAVSVGRTPRAARPSPSAAPALPMNSTAAGTPTP